MSDTNRQTTGLSALGSDRNALLAERFVMLADTLVDDFDVVELMDSLVSACVELLNTTAAALMIPDPRGRLQIVASSSEEARLLELLQLQNDEGPCLDCIRNAAPVSVDDIPSAHARWPRFADAANQLGFSSVHAVPMRLRNETIGGLNLFRAEGPALSPDEQRIAQALADVATIAVLQQRSLARAAQLAEQLQTALDSRVVIEQAKGVIAEFGGLDMGAAYSALRLYARDHNRKLAEVADAVVAGRVNLSSLVARLRAAD